MPEWNRVTGDWRRTEVRIPVTVAAAGVAGAAAAIAARRVKRLPKS
jgi:hypothetical protein